MDESEGDKIKGMMSGKTAWQHSQCRGQERSLNENVVDCMLMHSQSSDF